MDSLSETLKLLTFYLNQNLFGVPAADLTEVIRTGRLEQAHGASDATLGLVNFHGVAAPVLNLKRLLRLTPSAPEDYNKRLAVKTETGYACLAVDGIAGIMDVGKGFFDDPPPFYGPADKKYCKYYVKMGKALMPVLDIQEILKQARAGLPDDIPAFFTGPT